MSIEDGDDSLVSRVGVEIDRVVQIWLLQRSITHLHGAPVALDDVSIDALVQSRNRDSQEDLEWIAAGFVLNVSAEFVVRDISIDEVDGVGAGVWHEFSDFVDRFSRRLQEGEERLAGPTDLVDTLGRPCVHQPRAPRKCRGECGGSADPCP